MSAATKFYNSHKEQVLAYKKEWYAKKTYLNSFFKNIQIKGFSKSESNKILKTAIKCQNLKVKVDNDYYEILNDSVSFPLEQLVNTYKVAFSRIEVDCELGYDGMSIDNEEATSDAFINFIKIGLNKQNEQIGYLSTFKIKLFSNQLKLIN